MYLSDEATVPFDTQWRPGVMEKIYDGDSFVITVDVGYSTYLKKKVRLIGLTGLETTKLGVDAYEMRGEERELGKLAKAFVEEKIPVGTEVRVASRVGGSRGSFNRWLLCVMFKDLTGDWCSLGDLMLAKGHAEEWWSRKSSGAPRPDVPTV